MERHRNVKIESHVVQHTDNEVKHYEVSISWQGYPWPHFPKTSGEHKPLNCYKQERWKGEQVDAARILPGNVNINYIVKQFNFNLLNN